MNNSCSNENGNGSFSDNCTPEPIMSESIERVKDNFTSPAEEYFM